MQGFVACGHKVHAIEEDENQSQATMAFLRDFKPKTQLGKMVPNAVMRGCKDPTATDEKDETQAPVRGKCGMAKWGGNRGPPRASLRELRCHSMPCLLPRWRRSDRRPFFPLVASGFWHPPVPACVSLAFFAPNGG